MFKRLIVNMILTAVENEFSGFYPSEKDVEFLTECSDQFEIYFSVSTIFENCKITGSICTLGAVNFIKGDAYKTAKAYYNK